MLPGRSRLRKARKNFRTVIRKQSSQTGRMMKKYCHLFIGLTGSCIFFLQSILNGLKILAAATDFLRSIISWLLPA